MRKAKQNAIIFMLMAFALISSACGNYKSAMAGVTLSKKKIKQSENLTYWGEGDVDRINEAALHEISGAWGRGEYTYFADTIYKPDGKTVLKYRLTLCKTSKSGKDGYDPGCATGEGDSPKKAFDEALARTPAYEP